MRVVIQIMQKQKRGNTGLEAVKLVPGPVAVCQIKAASGNNSTDDEEKKPTRKDWKQGQKSVKTEIYL